MSEADTDWDSLLKAKEWVIDIIRKHSNPIPDLRQPLHYVIEATSTYHMPILRAWGGIPYVINPMLAGATKKKTDNLDAERLSFHDPTGVWPESFVASDDLQELRVLIAERNHYSKLATQCSNRINNIVVRFGSTIGRGTSVTKNSNVRAIVEDLHDAGRTLLTPEYALTIGSERFFVPTLLSDKLAILSETESAHFFSILIFLLLTMEKKT